MSGINIVIEKETVVGDTTERIKVQLENVNPCSKDHRVLIQEMVVALLADPDDKCRNPYPCKFDPSAIGGPDDVRKD